MKVGYKIFIGFSLIVIFYIVASLILMNNSLHMVHYYGYNDYLNAKSQKGVINPNIEYSLRGFSDEQRRLLKDNIFIYTTKSRYEEFFGFLISFNHEDKECVRVNIELKNSDSIGKIFDAQVRRDNKYLGLIYGASFDVLRTDEIIILDVIAYQNPIPINMGQMIIQLK